MEEVELPFSLRSKSLSVINFYLFSPTTTHSSSCAGTLSRKRVHRSSSRSSGIATIAIFCVCERATMLSRSRFSSLSFF